MDICWEDAVRRGNADIMRDLLSRGIDPNARDRHGQTGLMLAAHAGHLAVVQFDRSRRRSQRHNQIWAKRSDAGRNC